MKYSAIIAIKLQSIILRLAISFLASIIAALPFAAQEVTGGRIAIIDPDPAIPEFSQKIIAEIRPSFRVIDTDTALTAFTAARPDNPYNLSRADARRIADAIGCNFLVLLRTGLQPRQGIGRPAFVESFAAVFFVDGRSGRLRKFLLLSNEAGQPKQASALLSARAREIAATAKQIFASPDITPLPEFPELPAADSPENKNFRPPVPYKRIKPDYPLTAFLYSIQATIEIEADIDAEGRVGITSIVRWAGFGLDEAVEEVVRKMNWRPAYRDGRPLATRVLLRYNFRKPAKDENLRAIFRFLLLFCVTVALYSTWFLLRFFIPNKIFWRQFIFELWSISFLRIAAMEVEINGEPPKPPFFLVSNHLGYIDIPVLRSVVKGVFVAKHDIKDWFFAGRMIRDMGTIFINRGNRRDIPRAGSQIFEQLEKGEGVIVFPEGTSTRGEEVLPFNSSFLEFAARSGVKVCCVAISYRTPDGEPKPSEAICWWDDTPFLTHLLRLFSLKRSVATLNFCTDTVSASDRKELAALLREKVAERFIPIL